VMQFPAIPNRQAPAVDRGFAASPKLVKSAREFEAILLQDWLEKMNQSVAGLEENQDAAHDTLSVLGTQAIARALADRGGIGIARMILRQLTSRQSPDVDSEQKRTELKPPVGSSTPTTSIPAPLQEEPSETLKSSHKLPIIDLQAITGSEVRR